MKWAVTGANGNVGRRLIEELLRNTSAEIVAIVRSDRAKQQVVSALTHTPVELAQRVSTVVLDYTDVSSMCCVLEGVTCVVHLVGIIKESGGATYVNAHDKSSATLVEALRNNPDAHITYLSIVGATPTSSNACLASKGRAEVLFDNAANRACTLRLPMVLGEGDIVSRRLRARALKSSVYGLRMNSLEQPIYAGDVARAILAAGSLGINKNYDLGGLEIISRADLTRRAAEALTTLGERSGERAISIRSFPIGLGKIVVGIMQTLLPNPPLTMAMLEILDHDDQVDNAPVLQALGLGNLTGLDEALVLTLSGNTQS